MEARLEAARTRLDLAEVAHALGDRGQAQATLAEAVGMLRDLGLSKRAEQAAALARRLGVGGGATTP
jgi:hypothetical protein